jgi:predicted amidohydrolase
MNTTIATCAFPPTDDPAESLRLHLDYIEHAAAQNADLVVFPEAALQGFPPDVPSLELEPVLERWYGVAEPVPEGPSVQAIAEAAQRHDLHVVFGLTEAGERRGIVYNTAVLTGPDGPIGSYRKVHLGIGEQFVWRPGREWPVFETRIGRIGMLICWDKAFPEACRELVLGGADLLVMPTAWGRALDQGEGDENLCVRQYDLFDRVRAAENGRWFVSSNFIGRDGSYDYFGLSQIVDPLGDVVASSGTAEAGLTIATVDIEAGMARARSATQGAYLVRDRHPETYRFLRGDLPPVVDG